MKAHSHLAKGLVNNQGKVLVLTGLITLGLTSCGMFYSKVGERPGEGTDTSGKVSATDVAVTEYNFGDEAAGYVPFDSPLSYSLTVNQAAKDVGFGHEFKMVTPNDQSKSLIGRVELAPVGGINSASVTLITKGMTIESTACTKKPGTDDTPLVPEASASTSGLDAFSTYTCPLVGNWSAGKEYKVGIINTAADGVVIKITGEGFEDDKGYLKLTSPKGMELATSLKAYTRALRAFDSCAALPSGEAAFGTPVLSGKTGASSGDGGPIPACSDAIVITCTPSGCSHAIQNAL